MAFYNGWLIVSAPWTPWPASMEGQSIAVVAANENPFTKQKQIQSWGAQTMAVAVTFAPMTQANAQAWVAFLKSCVGQSNVFLFAAGLAAAFPETLTTDGTAQPYWRLMANQQKWSVKKASIYGLTFEVEQAV